ncbi:hypothetical protein CVIRNUC_000274 [Coccomyxa viridis]|uniref:HPP transmembrane region domain-containing protein n=1 Tax=Coccomyxa viridis TaxID=1274662 RepID=A0AAV1HTB4_9CHLO|nr:hypothetical protein CVIRNUC_000274 [Coccomyxa viridis]
MDGRDHGVLRLPSYCLCHKDACQCGGSKTSSSEKIYDTKQTSGISGQALAASILAWFGRMRGGSAKPPPAPPVWEVCLSGAGAFAGLLAIAALSAQLTGKINLPLLLGCFGASATLLFGMPSLPVAQPRNVFGGMGVSCLAGLFWRTVLGNQVWLAAPLGVAFSIMGMQLTATLHREALLHTFEPVIITSSFRTMMTSSHDSSNEWWTCISVRGCCLAHSTGLVSSIAIDLKGLCQY